MTIFDTKKNKAICVLPWIHEHLDLGGNQRPCCEGEILKRPLEEIRKEMLQGVKPRECLSCYKKEDSNEISPRMQETAIWLKKGHDPDTDTREILYLDVRNDPTCNLKCKMCGPHASTLWAKEVGADVIVPSYDLGKYNIDRLKKVYLAGGEPTYNKDYLLFVKKIMQVNEDCEIVINTNLKKIPEDWKNVIKQCKNLTVTISCDATGDLAEYMRFPLGWKNFEENVKFCVENANFVMFNLVATNLNTHKIHDTVMWMTNYSNAISVLNVDGDIWTHKAVPHKFRSSYIKQLEKCLSIRMNNIFGLKFRKSIQSLLKKYSSHDHDETLLGDLRNELKQQDGKRGIEIEHVDSFISEWVNK